MTEAPKASRSFPKGYRRRSGLAICVIFLFIICLLVAVLVATVPTTSNIFSGLGLIVILSICFIMIVWGMRRIYHRGFLFQRPFVYDPVDIDRKYLKLNRSPRQILVNEDNNKIYVATNNSIIVINGTKDDIVSKIKVKNPRHMTLNPVTDRLFVALKKGIAIIDMSSDNIIKTIFKEYRFGQLCVNYKNNMLYAINESYNSLENKPYNCVDVIECSSYSINHRIDYGGKPSGMAVNPNTSEIYIVYQKSNILSVIESDSNKASIHTHVHTPYSNEEYTVESNQVYFDPSNNKLYILRRLKVIFESGDIYRQELYSTDANVSGSTELYVGQRFSSLIYGNYVWTHLLSGACHSKVSFTVNPKLDRTYMTVIEKEGGLVVRKALFEIESWKVLRTLEIKSCCKSIAINPTTNKLYVANSAFLKNSIEIIYLEK